MTLEEAQELLKRPRELTREQWYDAYLAIQEHLHRQLAETLDRSRTAGPEVVPYVEVSGRYDYDQGGYFVEGDGV